MNKSYSELCKLKTYKERFDYLKCPGVVAKDTFGSMRYLNQQLYSSNPWRTLRNRIIARDNGFDMALDGYLAAKIVIHHINPITIDDFENDSDLIWNPENLVVVDFQTHQAIHYGDYDLIKPPEFTERYQYDTCPWRRNENGTNKRF